MTVDPRLSVVVPVYNAAATLPVVLAAIHTAAPNGTEIVVVDDASSDDSATVARAANARVVHSPERNGPAAARNLGARQARAEILVFVDADVRVAPDALHRIQEHFRSSECDAVFGSYDCHPTAPGLVSQYRNLLHHFVHQQGSSVASTFWAGLGAVRRVAFESVGGFDAVRYPEPSIEDIELGYRLRRTGVRIRLDHELLGTHLKAWTLRSMLVTDLRCRAIPWARLLLEQPAPADLNVTRKRQGVTLLVGMASVLAVAGAWESDAGGGALVALGAALALETPLFRFLARTRSPAFALAAVSLHLAHIFVGGLGFSWAVLTSGVSALSGGRRHDDSLRSS